MNIRKLEDLTKEELIELVKHEREHIADTRKMVPGEWKLVPVEPTFEMLKEIHINENFTRTAMETRYKAMLAAAPQTGRISDDWKETSPDMKAIKKGDMRVINGVLMTCTDPEIGRWQGSAPQPTEPCATCNDMGAVGSILNAGPCPDCTPATPTAKESLTTKPTDSEMWDWLIRESCTVLSFATGALSRKYKVIDFHGDDVSVGDTAREAITKAMRGEE